MKPPYLTFLEVHLAKSMAVDRKAYAQEIVQQGIPLQELFPLLESPYTTRSRFIWLLSDIGDADPARLRSVLPDLLAVSQKVQYTPLDQAFARLWFIAGVPPVQEGLAIDRMFDLLRAYTVNVSIKYNALRVLEKLMETWPDLTVEFILALEDQLGKHTDNFDNVIRKTIQTYRKENA
ncbi:MAG: hypothetical protein K9I85_10670 [Saprospiraceae bacterium]|nr:hypothetical protein [Saprospiraceae bacterium]